MDVTRIVPDTLMEVNVYFSDPRTCVEFMARMRWGADGPACPRCESKRLSFLETRLMWKCLDCQKQFSVKVNSIFEDSPIGLDKWLCAMWLIANCKNGVSSYEIARDVKVSQKAAWFMLQRIRHAMATGTFTKLKGEIEVDESFIGGAARFMHKDRKIKAFGAARGAMDGNKTIVTGILERKGKVRATVVHDRKKKTLAPFVLGNVEKGATIHSDEFSKGWYADDQFIHNVVNHAVEYVNGNVHTNGMENFWSLLKRGLKGTYISVEPFHLFRYVDEQVWRYNHRKDEDGKPLKDADRFTLLCSQVAGRRLTWDEVTGKTAGVH
jgi:transposase-like protein